MIILDEVKYAEKLIENGAKDVSPYIYLPILSRYYRQKLDYSPKKALAALNEYMTANYANYNQVKWVTFIDSCIKKSKKKELSEIPFVGITQKELDVIQSAKNNTDAKVLFSLLCLAKFFNLKRKENNSWTNVDGKDVFRMANVSATNDKQCKIIHEFYISGLVGFSKKVDNLNIQVLFVDDSKDYVLKISDFRNLGYEYMNWKQGGYFRCKECGILGKQNKYGNRIYCDNCVGYSPLQTKTIVCVDCGKEFKIDGIIKNKNRCAACYERYRRNCVKENVHNYRNKLSV